MKQGWNASGCGGSICIYSCFFFFSCVIMFNDMIKPSRFKISHVLSNSCMPPEGPMPGANTEDPAAHLTPTWYGLVGSVRKRIGTCD